jgi:hypothetical protein
MVCPGGKPSSRTAKAFLPNKMRVCHLTLLLLACGCGVAWGITSPTVCNNSALSFTAVERAQNTAELIQFCFARTPWPAALRKFTARLIHQFAGCWHVTLPSARGASLQNTGGGGGPHINTLCMFLFYTETCFHTERYDVPHMHREHIQLF